MLAQILAVSAVNLRGITNRGSESLVVVVGMATVVCVVAVMLGAADGFGSTLAAAGQPSRIVIVKSAELGKTRSSITREQVARLSNIADLATDGQAPNLVAEKIHPVAYRGGPGGEVTLAIHGVGSAASAVWPELRVLKGRWFTSGVREIVVGKGLVEQFPELQVGTTVALGAATWQIVGELSAEASSAESELWADADTVAATYAPGTPYNSVTARLSAGVTTAQIKDRITTVPDLALTAVGEVEYLASQSAVPTAVIRMVAVLVGLIMAAGVLFAAINTMYASIQSRSREVAALRALGFANGAVIVSVLVEAMALCVLGGLLGCAIAYVIFDGQAVSTMSNQTNSFVRFSLEVSPTLVLRSVMCGALLGLTAGFLPAIKAGRAPIAVALRGL